MYDKKLPLLNPHAFALIVTLYGNIIVFPDGVLNAYMYDPIKARRFIIRRKRPTQMAFEMRRPFSNKRLN